MTLLPDTVRIQAAQLGTRRKCSVGGPHAEHCAHEERGVHAETGGNGGKEPGDAEVEPVDGDEPAARARNHAHRVGVHGSDAAADALHDEEKSQAEPEAEVGRADDAEIEGAKTRDVGIIAEQADPQAGQEGDDQADGSAHGRDRRRRSMRSRGRDDTGPRPGWCRPWRRAQCRSRTRPAAGCIRDVRPWRSRRRHRVPFVRRFLSAARPRDW